MCPGTQGVMQVEIAPAVSGLTGPGRTPRGGTPEKRAEFPRSRNPRGWWGKPSHGRRKDLPPETQPAGCGPRGN